MRHAPAYMLSATQERDWGRRTASQCRPCSCQSMCRVTVSLSLSPSVCQSACLSVSIYVTSAPCAILARTKLPAKAKDARLLLLPPRFLPSSLPLAPSLRWMDFWIRNLHLDYKSDFDAYMRCTSYTYTIYIYIYLEGCVRLCAAATHTSPPTQPAIWVNHTYTGKAGTLKFSQAFVFCPFIILFLALF